MLVKNELTSCEVVFAPFGQCGGNPVEEAMLRESMEERLAFVVQENNEFLIIY